MRYALRALARSPVVTFVAIVSIALGIGANTAIFSVMNALMMRKLPVPNPDQLVSVYTISPEKTGDKNPISLAMLEEIEKRATSLSTVFAWNGGGLSSFEAGGQYFAAGSTSVSGNYYSALGVRPLLGRLIEPQDVPMRSGNAARVAVISYRFWQSRFHGDPAIVGKSIRMNDLSLTIIGVTPKSFEGILIDGGEDITMPFGVTGDRRLLERRLLSIYAYGRLKPGVSFEAARAEFRALWPSIQAASEPEGYTGAARVRYYRRKAEMESASTGQANLRVRLSKPLTVLMGLAGVVLLIACVNLANLMLSRAAGRQHELSVRAALGAGVRKLVMQLMTESLLLSGTGAALGFLVAIWTSRLLIATIWTGALPMALDATPDWRVLAFTTCIALVTGVLVGLAPAWRIARTDPADALRQNTRSVHGASFFARALVSAQVALSTVMVIAAALFIHSLDNLRTTDPGFRRNGILVMQLFAQPGKQVTTNLNVYYRELIRRVSEISGVAAASFSVSGPVNRYELPQPVGAGKSDGTHDLALQDMVGPGFFQLMGIHLLKGRDFDWRDDEKAQQVTILSESLASTLFPDRDPIGQTIDLYPGINATPMTVVGIVNSASLWRIQHNAPAAFYRPIAQAEPLSGILDIRLNGNSTNVANAARKVVEGMGHEYPLYTQTIEERINRMTVDERMMTWLAAFFGGLALLLATIGLYGLMAYSVTRRTPEIGVRMALGAERGDVTRLVLREVALLVGAGVLVGIPAAVGTSRWIAAMLFGVSPTDPLTIAAAISLLLAVAMSAGYLTARQAARIDPMVALRVE